MTRGVPPTSSIMWLMSVGSDANAVTGMPMPARASICMLRSLSRDLAIACDSFTEKTCIISNWRTTAVP